MPTNIDTGLTVQDAVNADHSPHIFTMSNGDLLTIYYNGTNLVWRSKSGGSWSAATTITLDTGVTPPAVSYLTRNGNIIFVNTSADPIDATHNGDFLTLTYTTSTHTLALTSHFLDNADGSEKAAGIGFISGAGSTAQLQFFHSNSAGSFTTIQEMSTAMLSGTDQVPTFIAATSSARTGLVTDGATTAYLMYGVATSGTAFKVERFTAGTAADNVETPPAPAANPVGVTAVYDGTNYTFVINENNAKLRYLLRTGTNTYGSWTDILTDASVVGQPTVCVKSGGDLAVFYRTNKNQANGEIWVVQRTAGVWGSPSLLAGGAATGWSNPSVAMNDLNDAGNARLVYVTGTASTWTLVEDVYAFTSGGGGGGAAPLVVIPGGPRGQWPSAPLRSTSRPTLTTQAHNAFTGLNTNDLTQGTAEQFYGDGTQLEPLVAPHGQWPNPQRRTQYPALQITSHNDGQGRNLGGVSLNALTADPTALAQEFYGMWDAPSTSTPRTFIAEADGTSTATVNTLTVSHNLVMEADGVSGATCTTLVVAHNLVMEADGISTASMTLTVSHPLVMEADGVSTATLNTVTVGHNLVMEADGTNAPNINTLVMAHSFIMEADGVAAPTLTLTVSHPLVAEADGVSTANINTLVVSHNLVMEADGVAAPNSNTLVMSHPLVMEADGVAAPNINTLVVSHNLVMEADGVSAPNINTLVMSHPLVMEADGVAAPTCALNSIVPFAFSAAGVATANINTLVVTHNLVMEADGVSTATSNTLVVSHNLVMEADGVSTATVNTLVMAHNLTMEADGVAGATINTLVMAHSFTMEADGISSATLTALISHPLVLEADGLSAPNINTLVVSHKLVMEADGVAAPNINTLVMAHSFTMESDGVSTATLTALFAHPLTLEADGVSTATLVLTHSVPLVLAVAGSSAPTCNLFAGQTAMTFIANGVSTASLPLFIEHILGGVANGVSTANSNTLVVSHNLVMQADGDVPSYGTIVTLSLPHPLIMEADGVATPTAALFNVKALIGQASGVASPFAALLASHLLTLEADGIASALSGILVTHPLVLAANGQATPTANVVVVRGLVCSVAGSAAPFLFISITHPGLYEADGRAGATLALTHATLLAAIANGSSAPLANLTVLAAFAVGYGLPLASLQQTGIFGDQAHASSRPPSASASVPAGGKPTSTAPGHASSQATNDSTRQQGTPTDTNKAYTSG